MKSSPIGRKANPPRSPATCAVSVWRPVWTATSWEACLTDATMAQAMFAKFQEDSEADDVSGTPTFLVDGQKVDNTEFQTNFRSILDAKIDG